MARTSTPPPFIKLANIGKAMEIRIWTRYSAGDYDDSSLQKFVGTLEAFYCDKNGMIVKLRGFDTLLVTTWEKHYIEASIE